MNKLKLIIQREFIAKVRNKSFIIMTFLSPLLVIAMGALVVYLMKKNDETIKKIAYIDNSTIFNKDDFKDTKTFKYEDFTKEGIEKTKEKVKNGDFYGVVFIPKKDNLEVLAKNVEFYSKNSPSLEIITTIESNIEKKLHHLKLESFNIDIEKLNASKINADMKLYNFSGDDSSDLTPEKSSKLSSGLKMGFGILAGYLLMMFVIVYGQSVMRSVIEEKTSRIIEVIVSSVKPFQLMMGKIIGNAMAGLLQFLIWGVLMFVLSVILSSFFGINVMETQAVGTPEQMEMMKNATSNEVVEIIQEILKLPLVSMFLLFIFYFLGGYLLYSSLYAAIGAAVDNEADSQQFMTPIVMPLVLAVYVGFTAVIKDPNGPVSVAFSHIPLTSPIVMLMRYPFGVAWWEVALSMAILLVTFVCTVWLAAKIYRVGILSYGKKPTYKDLIKWIRYKG